MALIAMLYGAVVGIIAWFADLDVFFRLLFGM